MNKVMKYSEVQRGYAQGQVRMSYAIVVPNERSTAAEWHRSDAARASRWSPQRLYDE